MARGPALSIVGSMALVGLAACGKSWFEEREPWRHEAEVECLKTGVIKEGPAIAQMRPIQGPGICGADFPLKVSALGDSAVLGFADDPRPPGSIPQYSPVPQARPLPEPLYPQAQRYPARPAYGAIATEPGGPMSISPSGAYEPSSGEPGPYAQGRYRERPSPYGVPARPYPPSPPVYGVPLAPSRAPLTTVGAATLAPAATLACPLVSALDTWMAGAVQPAALRWFGAPVVEIKQISAYSCRGMNGERGAPISEHAFGNALDIAAFTFADGRKVTVRDGWRGAPEERGFLHDVQAAACQQFSTVLAPGSNVYHYDHIHVDLARRASGRTICNPKAIPGDLVAGRRDPLVTGSIEPRASSRFPAPGLGRNRASDLPRAEPGED